MEIKTIIQIGVLGLIPTSLCAEEKEKTNIILINIDDLGWTDLSSNGSQYYETPNVDRLKSEGVWFNEAYAAAANSAPSRASMLTGMYTPRHGIFTVATSERGKSEDRKLIPIPNTLFLEENVQILPRVLKEAGYQTCHIGKWHVSKDPTKYGIDINIAGSGAGGPNAGYFSPYHNKNLKDGDKGEFLMDRIGNEAVNYLENVDKSKPFFLYYAPFTVHEPLEAERHLIEKYETKQGTTTHDNPVYAAMVEAMDRNVGKVLDKVKELGIGSNTLVVFTSDNGGVYRISKQWPLRAGKGSFYEGGIRVPMIIYQEGKFEKKSVENIPVSQIDLFPTFMELINIDTDDLLLDGESLLPLLKGSVNNSERAIFWHFPAYLEKSHFVDKQSYDPIWRTAPVSVVREGDWKLIEYYENGEMELFNIKNDISEKNDLSKQNPRKTKKLYKLLKKWKQEVNAPIPKELNTEYKNK